MITFLKRMSSLAAWFIYGDIDWEWWQENTRKWSPLFAGALFGAGESLFLELPAETVPLVFCLLEVDLCPSIFIAAWWSWADAIVYEHVSGAGSPPFKYCLPGVVATLALILINLVSRDDLAEISNTGDPGDNVSDLKWSSSGLFIPLLLKSTFFFTKNDGAVLSNLPF